MSSTSDLSTTHPLRILIVEDDPMIQLGLERILSSEARFEVVEVAEDGYRGVKAALEHKPDLIIMDIGLPKKDGIAAADEIKKQIKESR